jgi:hypothetical protein
VRPDTKPPAKAPTGRSTKAVVVISTVIPGRE